MIVTTNEWIKIAPGSPMPWKDREVLVRLSDGTKTTLVWNGMYWIDPVTRIRQRFFDGGLHPSHFYIFEKFNDKDL